MKKITLSADKELIDQARQMARRQGETLNEAFRAWLQAYVNGDQSCEAFDSLMEQLQHVTPGRSFTRDEMNQR